MLCGGLFPALTALLNPAAVWLLVAAVAVGVDDLLVAAAAVLGCAGATLLSPRFGIFGSAGGWLALVAAAACLVSLATRLFSASSTRSSNIACMAP